MNECCHKEKKHETCHETNHGHDYLLIVTCNSHNHPGPATLAARSRAPSGAVWRRPVLMDVVCNVHTLLPFANFTIMTFTRFMFMTNVSTNITTIHLLS